MFQYLLAGLIYIHTMNRSDWLCTVSYTVHSHRNFNVSSIDARVLGM